METKKRNNQSDKQTNARTNENEFKKRETKNAQTTQTKPMEKTNKQTKR